jgi:hypothetical protein
MLKEPNNKLTSDQNKAKRRLDLIDSSTGSHQDEGNSGFIDLIDPASDYLPDQLRFFLNQLRLRWRQYSRSGLQHIRTTMDSLKLVHAPDWLHVTSGQVWSFKPIEYASNRLCTRLDYHSVLKNVSHDQSEQDVKDFYWIEETQGTFIFSSSYMDIEYNNLQNNMHKRMSKFKTQSQLEDALVQLLS